MKKNNGVTKIVLVSVGVAVVQAILGLTTLLTGGLYLISTLSSMRLF